MLAGLLLSQSDSNCVAKQVFSALNAKAIVGLGIVGASYAAFTSSDRVVVYLVGASFAMLALAVTLEIKDNLRDRPAKSVAHV